MILPAPYRHPGDYGLIEVDGQEYRNIDVYPDQPLPPEKWTLPRYRGLKLTQPLGFTSK
jgi:hypothetical protein